MDKSDSSKIEAAPASNASFSERYGLLLAGVIIMLVLAGALVGGWLVLRKGLKSRGADEGAGRGVGSAIRETGDSAPVRDLTKLSQIMAVGARDSAKEEAAAAAGAAAARRPQFFEPPDASAWEKELRDLAARFVEAGTWREKLQGSRDPGRVEERMRDFYATRGRQEPRLGKFVSCRFFRLGNLEVAHLVHRGFSGRGVVEMAWVRDPAGGWKLDWESFVGAGEMDWEAFMTERPTRPVLLRVLAMPDEYFNYEFENAAQWISVKLTSADRAHSIHAYAPRDSELGRGVLAKLGTRAPARPATLRVAYPPGAASRDCVRLVEWVEDAWLLPEPQVPALLK